MWLRRNTGWRGDTASSTTSSGRPAWGSPWLLSECLGAGSTVVWLCRNLMNKGSIPGHVSCVLQQTQAVVVDGTQRNPVTGRVTTGWTTTTHSLTCHRARDWFKHRCAVPQRQREEVLKLRPCPFMGKVTFLLHRFASLVAQTVKNCLQCKRPRFEPWVRKTVWGRGCIHFTILAWEIPWTEEPGGLLQFTGSQRVRHLLKAAAAILLLQRGSRSVNT